MRFPSHAGEAPGDPFAAPDEGDDTTATDDHDDSYSDHVDADDGALHEDDERRSLRRRLAESERARGELQLRLAAQDTARLRGCREMTV